MVAELLSHGESRESHRSTCAWGLVHLSIYKCGLRLFQFFGVNKREVPLAFLHCLSEFLAIPDYARLEHVSDKVVAFTCTLSHSCKNGISIVSLGNVVDKLHDEHCLSHASTSEESNFSTLHVWFQQVNNLDTSSEHLFVSRQFLKLRGFSVDRICPFHA